jgi:hypothetical protein
MLRRQKNRSQAQTPVLGSPSVLRQKNTRNRTSQGDPGSPTKENGGSRKRTADRSGLVTPESTENKPESVVPGLHKKTKLVLEPEPQPQPRPAILPAQPVSFAEDVHQFSEDEEEEETQMSLGSQVQPHESNKSGKYAMGHVHAHCSVIVSASAQLDIYLMLLHAIRCIGICNILGT